MITYYTEGYIKEIGIGQGLKICPGLLGLGTPTFTITPAPPFLFEEEKKPMILLKEEAPSEAKGAFQGLIACPAETTFPMGKAAITLSELILLKVNKLKVRLTLEKCTDGQPPDFCVVGLKVL